MKIKLKITSGVYRSRSIICDLDKDIRPTQTKQRQSVFNILGNDLNGVTFLDICCGSGIIGFEALSRGADFVAWVDDSRTVLNNIILNAKNLTIDTEKFAVYCLKWQNAFKHSFSKKFDIIYFDPPFIRDKTVSDAYNIMTNMILENKVLNENGLFIAEYDSKHAPEISTNGFTLKKQKKYGNVGIDFWKFSYKN